MKRSLWLISIALGGSLGALAAPTPPSAPEALKVPADARLLLAAHATGVQIYACPDSGEHAGQWTLKGPEATLHDRAGHAIGHHTSGPTWQLNDGSAVTGKALAHTEAPDGKSVPWLLLGATGHTGTGLLTQVTAIQRLHTHGGQAPSAACTPQSPELRVRYSADYYFYASGAAP
jgi:hypothetical protein